jgi:FdhD protein
MARVTKPWRVTRLGLDVPSRERSDVLAGEEPLEIRIGGEPFTVTMRTPGNDFDLVAGFLVGEGIITDPGQIRTMDYRSGIGADGYRDYNVIDVRLADGVEPPDIALERHVYTSSSCGVCGTASIETVQKSSAYAVDRDPIAIGLDVLLGLPTRLREQQKIFGRTGGVHAAGLLHDGELVCVREDIGRHNAVDKVVGWALLGGRLPLSGSVLQVSSRASFELVQKASMAGIPVLSAVSAPSALAVQLAADLGVTVIGFNRGDTLNVYTRHDRISAGD